MSLAIDRRQMDYHRLTLDLDSSPSITLIRSLHAPLILSFLYHHFKHQPNTSLSLTSLTEHLEHTLTHLRQDDPVAFPRKAKEYLSDWAEKSWLRIRREGSGEDTVELTSHTERVFGWLESMRQRAFIGTESRFLSIFQLLEEIVVRSTEDPEIRMASLEAEKAALQREIDLIQQTGQVERYSSTQIRERFLEANRIAGDLRRDFAAIEENFRGIARQVQQSQMQPDTRKGAVVGAVLRADEQVRASDEGRSFDAFWKFLMTPERQERFDALLLQVYSLPELQSDLYDSILRNLTRALIEGGQKIIQSNRRLIEQLRRILDEQALAEHRRVGELLQEVQQRIYHALDETSALDPFIEIEGLPYTHLFMERPLYSRPQQRTFEVLELDYADSRLDPEALENLYNRHYVDETLLQDQIAQLLENRSQVTLPEVVEAFPIQKGLAEILAYYNIAHYSEQHSIDPETYDTIAFKKAEGMAVWQIPRVTFQKSR